MTDGHLRPALSPTHPLLEQSRERGWCGLVADDFVVVGNPSTGCDGPERRVDVFGKHVTLELKTS